MITTPTVLVLGAGASMHLGFPSGTALIQQILGELLAVDGSLASACAFMDFGEDLRLAFRSALANSASPSIDQFLADNPKYEEIGKLCIAVKISDSEQQNHPDVLAYPENWYQFLFNKLASPRIEDWHKNQLSIITFNYDRSLEFHLQTYLSNRFEVSPADLDALLDQIQIVHVHGSLGELPRPSNNSGVFYGQPGHPGVYRTMASKIRILHENRDDSEIPERCAKLLRSAERILFLGFGYLPENIRRLGFQGDSSKRILGTSFGLTPVERASAQDLLTGLKLKLPAIQESSLRETEIQEFLRHISWT